MICHVEQAVSEVNDACLAANVISGSDLYQTHLVLDHVLYVRITMVIDFVHKDKIVMTIILIYIIHVTNVEMEYMSL